jgi:hypothetical protein
MGYLQGDSDLNNDSYITHNELNNFLSEKVPASAYGIDREQDPTWNGVDGNAILTQVY